MANSKKIYIAALRDPNTDEIQWLLRSRSSSRMWKYVQNMLLVEDLIIDENFAIPEWQSWVQLGLAPLIVVRGKRTKVIYPDA